MICTKCGNQINDSVKFCKYCGNAISVDLLKEPSRPVPVYQVIYQQVFVQQPIQEKPLAIYNLRLIIGIISVVLFFFIEFSSCVMTINDAFSDKLSISGASGILVGFWILIAGILSIAARKSLAGTIVAMLFFIFAILPMERFGDLLLWTLFSILCLVLLLVSVIIQIVAAKRKNDWQQ